MIVRVSRRDEVSLIGSYMQCITVRCIIFQITKMFDDRMETMSIADGNYSVHYVTLVRTNI